MPLTAGSAFSVSISAASSSCAGVGRRARGGSSDAGLLARLALVAHVDVRGRVVAHEDRGEPGLRARRRPSSLDLAPHPLAHPRGDGLAVDDPRAHRLLERRVVGHQLALGAVAARSARPRARRARRRSRRRRRTSACTTSSPTRERGALVARARARPAPAPPCAPGRDRRARRRSSRSVSSAGISSRKRLGTFHSRPPYSARVRAWVR